MKIGDRINKLREWIIHKLGGITKSELPRCEKIVYKTVNLQPVKLTCRYSYTFDAFDANNSNAAVEGYAKKAILEELMDKLDESGFVQYTSYDVVEENFDPFFVRKEIRADLWVVNKR